MKALASIVPSVNCDSDIPGEGASFNLKSCLVPRLLPPRVFNRLHLQYANTEGEGSKDGDLV